MVFAPRWGLANVSEEVAHYGATIWSTGGAPTSCAWPSTPGTARRAVFARDQTLTPQLIGREEVLAEP